MKYWILIFTLLSFNAWGLLQTSGEEFPGDIGLPIFPPFSSDLDGLPGIIDPWADETEEEANEEAAGDAVASCMEVCHQAEAAFERGAEDPCSDTNVSPDFYCRGTNRARINPFEIYRALSSEENTKEDGLSRVCIQYLLQRAKNEMERADRQLVLNTREREYSNLAQAMYALHDNCRELSNQFPEVAELTSEALNQADMTLEIQPHHDNYCNMVGKGCAWLGGWERRINGEQVCVAGGMVLDQSCLEASPARQRRIRYAVRKVRGRSGLGCLSDLNEIAGENLRDILQDQEPNTRVCCGRNCETELEGFPEGSTSGGSMGRTVGADGPKGDIHLFNSALGSNRQAAGTLFHELLHRTGMCTHPNHDDSQRRLVQDQSAVSFSHLSPSCNRGYSPVVINSAQIDAATSNCEEDDRLECLKQTVSAATGVQTRYIFPSIRPDENISGTIGQGGFNYTFCVRRNMCGGGIMRAQNLNDMHVMDPVYACENACFGTGNRNAGVRNWSRRVCSATADGEGSTCEAQEMTNTEVTRIRGSR